MGKLTLKLTLHDKFTLTRDGRPIDLRSRKAQALLVYLALTGKPHSREHLATLLWGDRFDEQARRSLRQAVFALRKAVGPDVVVGEGDLRLAEGAVDVDGGGADLLPDFRTGAETFDFWLTEERASLRGAAIASLETQARTLAEEGEVAGCIDTCDAILTTDPLNEEILVLLMQQLAAGDRRTEAMKRYTAFAERLRAELDAEPAKATTNLAEMLRSQALLPEDTELSYAEITATPHAAILPFEYLGGGDMAAMVASEFANEVQIIYDAQRIIAAAPTEMVIDPATGKVDALKTASTTGALFVLTGTVAQIGDTVRISARYLSVQDGTTKWSHRDNFPADSAFESMVQLARTATYNLALLITELESTDELLAKLRQNALNRVAFLKLWKTLFWRAAMKTQTRANLADFREMTEIAVKFAPKETEVLVTYSFLRFHQAHVGDGKDRVEAYREARKPLDEAFSRNPNTPDVLVQRTIQSIWINDHETAELCYATLAKSGRGIVALEGLHGTSLAFQNRNDEAIAKLTMALSNESGTINLFYRFSFLGLAYFNLCQFNEALENAERALDVGREFFIGHLVKIAALERLGRHDDAVQALEDMRLNYRDPSVSEFDFLPFSQEEPKQNFLNALREAGLPE